MADRPKPLEWRVKLPKEVGGGIAVLSTATGWKTKDRELQQRLNDFYRPNQEGGYSPDSYSDAAREVEDTFKGEIVNEPEDRERTLFNDRYVTQPIN